MIPKRMFFYWSGDKLSWMRYMTLFSFKKMNPDWEIILYYSDNKKVNGESYDSKEWNGPEEQDFSNYNGGNYLDQVKDLGITIINFEDVDIPNNLKEKFKNISPVHKSDMYRYYDLYKNGGFYSDMDVLYFRSFDNEYNKIVKNDYDTILYQQQDYIAIGFLGSKENNKFYKKLYKSIFDIDGSNNYQAYGVDAIYNMFGKNRSNAYIFSDLEQKFPFLKHYSIPTSLVYHYDWSRINDNYRQGFDIGDFSEESIGYHWYGGHKESQKANNDINEENYHRYKITFSNLVKHIL